MTSMQTWRDLVTVGVDQEKNRLPVQCDFDGTLETVTSRTKIPPMGSPGKRDPCPTRTSWKKLAPFSLTDGGEGQGSWSERMSGDRRSHLELSIYWSPSNVQKVLALVDTSTECTLIYRNPEVPWTSNLY